MGRGLGVCQELGALQFGSFMVPRVANGQVLDTHLRRNHGETVELELKHRKFFGQTGRISFLGYVNHANMGTYRDALSSHTGTPDITLSRHPGTPKYGLGLNAQQPLTRDLGAFLRWGWNDGKTESWIFTEIDRTLSLGLQMKGRAWQRSQDVVGLAWVNSGILRDHLDYLAAGGSGFILGDGRLQYSPERILESYYSVRLRRIFFLTVDYQWAQNPGYNRQRGPVSIWALRFYWRMRTAELLSAL